MKTKKQILKEIERLKPYLNTKLSKIQFIMLTDRIDSLNWVLE